MNAEEQKIHALLALSVQMAAKIEEAVAAHPELKELPHSKVGLAMLVYGTSLCRVAGLNLEGILKLVTYAERNIEIEKIEVPSPEESVN